MLEPILYKWWIQNMIWDVGSNARSGQSLHRQLTCLRSGQWHPATQPIPWCHPRKYKDVPYLVAVTKDVKHSSGNFYLREMSHIENNPNTSNNIWKQHPPEHSVCNVGIKNHVAEWDPVCKRCHRVECKAKEEWQGNPSLVTRTRSTLQEQNCSKHHCDQSQVKTLVQRETLEIVNDDPDIGSIEGQEDCRLVQSLPRSPCVMARHRVKKRTRKHTCLVSY